MRIWPFTNLTRLPTAQFFSLVASLLLISSNFLLVWLNLPKLPLEVPLWFTKPWGESWLASPNFLWVIPLSSSGVFLVNTSLAVFFWNRERIISLTLFWVSPVIALSFFIALFEIIRVSS
jgi:hypothetical protein